MRCFRVYPHVASVARAHIGHALHRPPRQGTGRIDNPQEYLTLYAAGRPSVSVAEIFAAQPSPWDETTLYRADSRPYYLAEIEFPDERPVCNLDDPRVLLDRMLKPSSIVSRDRTRTQAWALDIFHESRWDGVSWWSFYDPDVPALGLWNLADAAVVRTEILRVDSEPFIDAAKLLNRTIHVR